MSAHFNHNTGIEILAPPITTSVATKNTTAGTGAKKHDVYGGQDSLSAVSTC